jgi:hypothetical protein
MEGPPENGGATDRLENGALQLSHYDSFPPSNSIFALLRRGEKGQPRRDEASNFKL